jgi:RNA 3'-terminal phosphate cyclase (ATP)
MGPRVVATLEQAGFYPAGGGRLRVQVTPVPRLAPLELDQRGEITARRAQAVVSNLPRSIAEREIARMANRLEWPATAFTIAEVASAGPGNIVLIEVETEHLTEVMVGSGEKGVRAESVADSAVDEARAYLASDAPVGCHLADQLVLPLALAGDGHFRTLPPTQHTRTQLEVIPQFLDGVRPRLTEQPDGSWRFDVR